VLVRVGRGGKVRITENEGTKPELAGGNFRHATKVDLTVGRK